MGFKEIILIICGIIVLGAFATLGGQAEATANKGINALVLLGLLVGIPSLIAIMVALKKSSSSV